MTQKIIDVTKQVGEVLDKAGFGDDSNNSLNIKEAGLWDLCDAVSGQDNSKFSKEDAQKEMESRGL